jgi:hypothetical protein
MQQPFEGDDYRPLNWRRRLLIVLLALGTASTVLLYMLGRRGEIEGGRPHPGAGPALPADVARCKPGQTEGCVGGMATLIIAPAGSAAVH